MYQAIINFWFEEIDKSKWWVKDVEFDSLIRAKFSEVHKRAANCELFEWRKTALGMLAEVIVLDQFSRNMYRNKPESFAYDSLALALSQTAIAGGYDSELNKEQRSFLYMPFMHSESLLIHAEAESLFRDLGIESIIEFEKKHRVIIERFGRYSHRNKILGRISTAEESAFLNLPGSSF